jgi:hypothetical protein
MRTMKAAIFVEAGSAVARNVCTTLVCFGVAMGFRL